jgi:hypothetical protein
LLLFGAVRGVLGGLGFFDEPVGQYRCIAHL